MDVVPILSLMIFLPALGALLIFCIPKEAEEKSNNVKKAAFFVSLSTFFVAVMVWGFFEPGLIGYQFVERREWLPDFGISYAVGIDGLALPFIFLVASCVPLLCCTVRESETTPQAPLYLLFLLLETCLIGALSSLDLILFYVFSECAFILVVFILVESIRPIQKKVFLAVIFWSLITSMLFLVALLYLANELYALVLPEVVTHMLSRESQIILWACFFGYFILKTFLFPLYICFSSGIYETISGGDILGGMGFMIVGFYGLLRFVLPLFPQVTTDFAPWIQSVTLLIILLGSIWILSRQEVSKIAPLMSILQMMVAIVAVFLGTNEALVGSVFLVINQLIIWVAVLFCLEVMHRRPDPMESGKVRRSPRFAPLLTFFFIFFLLSGLGFPGTSGFMGWFLVMMGACSVSPFMGGLLAISGILMSVAFLWTLKRAFYPQADESGGTSMPLRFEEVLPLGILGVTVVALGFFPTMVTVLIQAPIDHIIMVLDHGEPVSESVLFAPPRVAQKALSSSVLVAPR